jgi:N-acetylmuramoyl-L-alanine amidase
MVKKSLCILFYLGVMVGCSYKQYPAVTVTKPPIIIYDTVYVKLPPTPIVPPSTTNPIDSLLYDAHTAETPNFNLRKPNFVIIHHTAQNSCEQTFYTFSLQRTQVSAHYVICRDGTLHHLLNDYLRAWHAGVSKWGAITDMNSCSIGIELDNNGKEPFAPQQINTLLTLLDTLKKTYNIPTANFIGHADIAPRRKDDPSVYFPWKLLAQNGFGLWQDSIPPSLNVDSSFNPMEALSIIGYDISDSTAAIVAFKRHFLQDESSKTLNEWDKKTLFNLYKKYF